MEDSTKRKGGKSRCQIRAKDEIIGVGTKNKNPKYYSETKHWNKGREKRRKKGRQ